MKMTKRKKTDRLPLWECTTLAKINGIINLFSMSENDIKCSFLTV